MNRLFFLLLLVSYHVSSYNYLFRGCEVEYTNPKFTTTSDILKIPVARARESPVKIKVPQDGKPFKLIEVPLPTWQWSHILINMTEKLQVIYANNIYSNEMDKKRLKNSQTKEIEVVGGRSVANCPQGLFYRKVGHIYKAASFPSPDEEKKTDEVYILYPLDDLTVKLGFCPPLQACPHSHLLCWNESQLEIVNASAECHEIPRFQYLWLTFHFENGQVTVMNGKGLVLDSLPVDDGSRVWFRTKGVGKIMFIIQCAKDCEPENVLPPGQETRYFYVWMVATRILFILGLVLILECLRRLYQINKLHTETTLRNHVMTFRYTAHSADSPDTQDPRMIDNVHVSLDELRGNR